ncbi:MAG: YkoF family thiamine/hydroxymethylpyrimidine-binding protein [Candidatus Binatus sp.]|uniref:YkoF family thiamine/hydroxymethylpyrimidine-binding protein n=1 Tax=Candidatus Binatus sp. TaxID=2811406 RepID=UPI003C7916C0
MTVSAQISVYPLRQEHLGPAVESVRSALEEHRLTPHVGPMSTTVTGESGIMFAALADAFTKAASSGELVMTITISNACLVAS